MKKHAARDELVLLEGKNTPSRLVFALLLKFFQLEARFPEQKAEIPALQ